MKSSILITASFLVGIFLYLQTASGQSVNDSKEPSPGERFSKIFSLSEGRAEIFSRKRFERNAILGEIDELRIELRSKEARISELVDIRASKLISGLPFSSFSSRSDIDEQIRIAVFELENTESRDDFELERLNNRLTSSISIVSKSDQEIQEEKELKRRISEFPKLAKLRKDQNEFRLDNLKTKKKEQQIELKKQRDELSAFQLERQEEKSNNDDELARLTSDIKSVKIRLREKSEELDKKNDEISRLIDVSDADTSFRFSISMIFAGLVCIVIIGFFIIIRSNERVVFEIFSKDSGIQFITLFSIVIAIILFGITGVLEGKELSALLAGLSGYILGRGSGLAANGPQPAPHSRGISPPNVGGPAPASNE